MPGIGGETIGTAYVRIIADGDGLDDSIEKEFRRAEPRVRKAGEEHADGYDEGWTKNDKKNSERRMQRLVKSLELGQKRFDKIGEQLGDGVWDGLTREFEKRTKSHALASLITQDLQNQFRKNGGNFAAIGRIIERDFTRLVADAGRELDRMGHELEQTGTRSERMARSIQNLGERTGRAFGKGSRNDFVNFFGSFVGNLVSATQVIPRVAQGVGRLGSFFSAFAKEGGGITSLGSRLSAGMEAAGTSFAQLAVSAGTAGIALGALAIILPTIVSILTLAGGVVVALAGSISFALVGALGALMGLLIPAGAAVAVLALAFGGLGSRTSEAHKQLSAFLKPVTSQLKELALVTKQHLFANLTKDGKDFGKGLGNLRPLVVSTADALSKMFSDVTKASASPAFARYIKTISDFTKTALPQLGAVVGHTVEGFAGVFEAVIPLTQRLLDSMTRGSQTFAEWANSAGGQNQLATFFKRAGDSAADLGHLLIDVTKLLGSLFSSGKGSGDTIIDHLDSKVRDLTKYLDSHPKSVAAFFGDVTDFADGVGRATLAIIHLIDTLDDPQSRKQATAIFDGIANGIESMMPTFRVLSIIAVPAIHAVETAMTLILSPFKSFIQLITGDFSGALATMIGVFTSFLKTIGSIGSALGKIPGVPDLGKPFKAAAQDLQNLQDKLNGKPIKPHVDTSEMDILKHAAHTTDESLRILLGLPKLKPKADGSEIGHVKTGTDSLIDSMHRANGTKVTPKVNSAEVLQSRIDILRARQSFLDFNSAAAKRIQLKIDALQAKIAHTATVDLLNALRSVFNLHSKTITVTTNYVVRHKTVAATGGIMDQFGNIGKRMAAGGIKGAQFDLRGNTVAEAGREAIVPLDRPLNQVDPSVRYLAAIAQGYQPGGGTRTVTIAPTIITPTKDPVAVTKEVTTELAVLGAYN